MNTPEAVLRDTSRTFAIPILHLTPPLQQAVTSAYLSCRAIDEIEDHPRLPHTEKANVLRTIAHALEAQADTDGTPTIPPLPNDSPEVTQRLGEWLELAPSTIRLRINEAVATMATRMATWADAHWHINTEEDLDRYTYDVAGAIGILLTDLWNWNTPIPTNRTGAANLGRGLQAVNILTNRTTDHERGIDFYPPGWTDDNIRKYATNHLANGWQYIKRLPSGVHRQFCSFPTILAELVLSGTQLSRAHVKRTEDAIYNQRLESRDTLLRASR